MFIRYFLLLLLGHVLGDFYLQTSNIAAKKENSLKWVFIHCAGYWGMMLLVCLPIMSWEIAIGALIAAILHLIIDIVKFVYVLSYNKQYIEFSKFTKDSKAVTVNKKASKARESEAKFKKTKRGNRKKRYSTQVKESRVRSAQEMESCVRAAQVNDSQDEVNRLERKHIFERNTFFIDQVLHIVCICAISYLLLRRNIALNEWPIVKEFFHIAGISRLDLMAWFLALLLIHKPANITIAKLLLIYKPKDTEENKDTSINTGRFIGSVERIIMLIFLSIGQYSAIGLVLTAKSIARYDRITKDTAFAEYYLLGTLLSTLIAILTSFIL